MVWWLGRGRRLLLVRAADKDNMRKRRLFIWSAIFALLAPLLVGVINPQRADAYTHSTAFFGAEWLNAGTIRVKIMRDKDVYATYVLRNTAVNGDPNLFTETDVPTCEDNGVERPYVAIRLTNDTTATREFLNLDNTAADGTINCFQSNFTVDTIKIDHPERRHHWFFKQDTDTIYSYDRAVSFKKVANAPVAGTELYMRENDPVPVFNGVTCRDAIVKDTGNRWLLFPMSTPENPAYPPAAGAKSEAYRDYTNNGAAFNNCRVDPAEMLKTYHLGNAAVVLRQEVEVTDGSPCDNVSGLPKYVTSWPVDDFLSIDPVINEMIYTCANFSRGMVLEKASRMPSGLISFRANDFLSSGDDFYYLGSGMSTIAPVISPTTPDADELPEEKPATCGQGDRLAWLFCPVIETMQKTINGIDKELLCLLKINTAKIFNDESGSENCFFLGRQTTGPTQNPGSDAYYQAWGVLRNISMAILLLAGLVMVAMQVLGFEFLSAYQFRKMLPGIIAVAVIVPLTWPAMQFLYTAANAAADAVMALIHQPFANIDPVGFGATSNFGLAFLVGQIIGTVAVGGVLGGIAYLALLGPGGILALVGTVLLALFSAWILLVARDVVATLLVLAAPIAVVCKAIGPLEKVFSLWKGLVITITASIPVVAAVIQISHEGALISFINNQTLIAIVIFIAGYALIWTIFKQIDQVAGQLGNVVGKATAAARKGLADYRSDTLKRRLNETVEGTRTMGGPGGWAASLARRGRLADYGGFSLSKSGMATYAAAQRKLYGDAADKLLEQEKGRASGDDDATMVAMQGYNKEDSIRALTQRIMQNPGNTMTQAEAEASARTRMSSVEANFRAKLGTSTMRVAAHKAHLMSNTTYRAADYGGSQDAADTAMYTDAARLINDGLIDATGAAAAIKANKQRADRSGAGFATVLMQADRSAKRMASGAATIITQDEIRGIRREALYGSPPGAIVAGRHETVTALAPLMREDLREALDSGDPVRAGRKLAEIAARYDVMGQVSPQNAEIMAREVMSRPMTNPRTGEVQTVQQIVESYRGDEDFRTMRREYGIQEGNAATAYQQQMLAEANAGRIGAIPDPTQR